MTDWALRYFAVLIPTVIAFAAGYGLRAAVDWRAGQIRKQQERARR